MNNTFAPTMPTTMATSETVHTGPTARWSPAITRDWIASATAMPRVTITPQMPGRIPGTRAKGVRQVLTGSADPTDGAHLRQNRAAGPPRPATGVTLPDSLDPRAVSEIGPLPGTTSWIVSSWTNRSPGKSRPFTSTRCPENLTVTG